MYILHPPHFDMGWILLVTSMWRVVEYPPHNKVGVGCTSYLECTSSIAHKSLFEWLVCNIYTYIVAIQIALLKSIFSLWIICTTHTPYFQYLWIFCNPILTILLLNWKAKETWVRTRTLSGRILHLDSLLEESRSWSLKTLIFFLKMGLEYIRDYFISF